MMHWSGSKTNNVLEWLSQSPNLGDLKIAVYQEFPSNLAELEQVNKKNRQTYQMCKADGHIPEDLSYNCSQKVTLRSTFPGGEYLCNQQMSSLFILKV